MTKKFLCLLLSVILTFTVGGSFVFAEEIGLPLPGDQAILENPQPREEDKAEETVRKLEELRTYTTGRFIVKLKETSNVSLEAAAETAFESAKDAKEQEVSAILEVSGVNLETVYNEKLEADPISGRLKMLLGEIDTGEPALMAMGQSILKRATTKIDALQEDKQVISLPEKVDTDVFVQEVQDSLGEEIEYIQPDYELELAANEDESLSLEVVPISPGGSLESELEAKVGPVPSAEPAEGLEPTEEPAEPETLPSAEPENTVAPAPSTSPESETPEATPKLEPTPSLESVIVAVIDTGIDVTHPDLADHIVDGYNFVSDNEQVYDAELGMEQAHGTHVAGIIAQTAPDAKIMPLKCFENGRAYTSDLIRAIDFAKENGASIVNCSWGSKDNNQALKEAMEHSGLFFVCAAGNNRMDVDETPIYPASFGLNNSISVTSLNQDYGFSYYSNYGTSIDIAAIGRDVESTFPGGERGKMNGSSMSAGYISGAAAIAKASGDVNLKDRIISTGDRLSNLQNKLRDGRALNLNHLISNIQSDEILDCTPAADFDVHGHQPTPEENWDLFSSVPNIQVAAGDYFSVALKEDGTVWAWGKNNIGQLGDDTKISNGTPRKISGLSDIRLIAAGADHILALKNDGTVYAWGYGVFGQLGDGTNMFRTIPTLIPGLNNVKAIACGGYHTLALKEDGTVYAWGLNEYSQVGDGTTTGRSTPTLVSELNSVKSITAGYAHTLALKEDGTVYGWGANADGQLGDGTHTKKSIPTLISGLSNVRMITAGYSYTMALKEDGTVYTWGRNLGEVTPTYSLTPTQVTGLIDVTTISAGHGHAIAIKENGSVVTWGDNSSGQLGDKTKTNRIEPTLITGVTFANAIAAGTFHTLAVTDNGTVSAWGDNTHGQLGDGSMKIRTTPHLIPKLNKICAIETGSNYAVALREDGMVYTWGDNQYGQLGDGTTECRSTPTSVNGLKNIKEIVAGYSHTFALTEDGKVYAWGNNNNEQLGIGIISENAHTKPNQLWYPRDIKSIAAGSSHTYALTEDGKVYAWGSNDYGQLGDGTTKPNSWPTPIEGLSNLKAISAGPSHALALTKEGTVYSWGNNFRGQLGDGSTTNRTTPSLISDLMNIKMVAALSECSFALTNEGTVYAWGKISMGQLVKGSITDSTIPTLIPELKHIEAIDRTGDHIVALKDDGTVYAWGPNDHGQLGDGTFLNHRTPDLVPELNHVRAVAAGNDYSLVLKDNGTIYAWGSNEYGQLGDGRTLKRLTPYQITALGPTQPIVIEDEQYNTPDNAAYHADQAKLESIGWKEGYYYGKGEFSAETGKLIIKKTSPQESGYDLIYDVTKNFTARSDNWNNDSRVSVWTQHFKGDYEIKLKSSFNQPSSQVYYDIVGGDSAGNDAVLGRYRVDPGSNGDFSVYNGNLNKPGTTSYPLWKNPQVSRTISTVTNFEDATFQTFVDGSETPSKTTIDGAVPDDTFSMTDWGQRTGSTYIKGIRLSAQKQAPVNSEIARIDSLQFIEHRVEHDIVDDAISVMDMSIVTDTPEAVVSDLKELPAELAGAAITWTSSHPNLISNTGKLNSKPAFTTDVTMTAKITNPTDQYTKYMDFKLTVPVQSGFEETYTGTFTGTASSAGIEGTKNFEQLPMWEFSYPGIANGTNGEVHSAQVLEKNNYLVFKKISDRQTANYKECLVGMRSLSSTDIDAHYSAATVNFTTKTAGTGTVRFAPVTPEGNPVCTVILDASTKHIEIVYGEEQNGELVKVTQRIDSIDPTVDHDYVLDLKEDNTFSVYVDGALKLTDQNALIRKYQPEAGVNPVLSKFKAWITNITYANTEVGNLKRLSVYNAIEYTEPGPQVALSVMTDQEYALSLSGKNIREFVSTYVITYDQSILEAIDLIGQSYPKEMETGAEFKGIHIIAYTPGRIEIKLDQNVADGQSYSGFINAVKFKGLSTGDSTIHLSK